MSDKRFDSAIDALLEALREQEKQVVSTKTTINNLRRMSGDEPLFADIEQAGDYAIRPDLFYGKGPVTAAREFLESRNRIACSQEDILAALEKGGFDFAAQGWSDAGRLRNLAISLSKNSAVFHKLPNGSWGLVTWYDHLPNRRGAAKSEPKDAGDATPPTGKEKGGEARTVE